MWPRRIAGRTVKPTTTTARVFGYARVSTAEQANNGDSIYTQRQAVAGYAVARGWQVAEFFVDRGVSGSVPLTERPEGQRLLASVAAGDMVITARLDRAFRSADDALATLKEFKEQGVGLHMIDLGGDVCGNSISKFVFTILTALAESDQRHPRVPRRQGAFWRNRRRRPPLAQRARSGGHSQDAGAASCPDAASQD
jgi:DNA invertase Pin-like site-specific DNA recombinase